MKTLEILKSLVWSLKSPIIFWWRNLYVQINNPLSRLSPQIVWSYDDIKDIDIASGVTIGSFSVVCVTKGASKSTIIGSLKIESRAAIGSHANIRATGGTVFIGKNSILAQQVSLIGCNHTISLEKPYRDLPWDKSETGITIKENVWIGAGVTVLPGCTIGNNSIVGAGSVVTKSIPENEIWAGVPARKIRAINFNHQQNNLFDSSLHKLET